MHIKIAAQRGVVVGIQPFDSKLIYEIKVPLHLSADYAHAIGISPGDSMIDVMVERTVPEQQLPGSSSGGSAGSDGVMGGGHGGGRGHSGGSSMSGRHDGVGQHTMQYGGTPISESFTIRLAKPVEN